MTGRNTHNIVTFEHDDEIVQAVQQRMGLNDYSAAVRAIIREFGRINGLPESAPRLSKARRSKQGVEQLNEIAGVKRGTGDI